MLYGILASFLIMLIGLTVTKFIPGYPLEVVTTSLLLGILAGNLLPKEIKEKTSPGIQFSEKKLLEFAIVLMGLKLNINYLFKLGPQALLFVLVSIACTLALAPLFGKLFKLNTKESLLTGVGNSVCGSSAIAAINPLLGVPLVQMGMTIGVVNFLGTLGIFITPFLANLLQFTDIQTSYLIGGTLQAVGHVAAAGFSLGDKIGEHAIIIKMFRVLMIGPIVLLYSLYSTSQSGSGKFSLPSFPLFLLGFILASIIITVVGEHPFIGHMLSLSKILLAIAMAAIGWNISFSSLKNKGASILYTGGSIFIFQIVLAVALIYLLKI